MNELGYGVISLYHTLIKEIDRTVFPVEAALSQRILNLPIHQDVDIPSMDAMLTALEAVMDFSGA